MKKSLIQFITIIPLVFLLCFTFSCQQQVEEGITEEEAKAQMDRVLELWNEGNLALVEEIYAPEIVSHSSSSYYEDIVGFDGVKNRITSARTVFPDFNLTIEEIIVKGDKIVARWTYTGTNTGPNDELPPTGKKVRISGITMVQVVNGKCVEERIIADNLDLYLQLGFTLTPPQPPAPQEKE